MPPLLGSSHASCFSFPCCIVLSSHLVFAQSSSSCPSSSSPSHFFTFHPPFSIPLYIFLFPTSLLLQVTYSQFYCLPPPPAHIILGPTPLFSRYSDIQTQIFSDFPDETYPFLPPLLLVYSTPCLLVCPRGVLPNDCSPTKLNASGRMVSGLSP